MTKLIDIFREIKTPQEDSKNFFYAKSINVNSKHKIARDFYDRPSLLISTPNDYKDLEFRGLDSKDIPYKLENLVIRQNVECIINKNDGEKGKYTVLTFTGNNDLKTAFFDITETLLCGLSDSPTSKEIHSAIQKLINLLKSIQTPVREIQGLCGELMIILHSNHTENLISAWHAFNHETYDFSFNEKHIEVKSSNNEKRIHHFSLRQLSEVENSEVYIASVIMNRSSGGVSIEELLTKIFDKVHQDPSMKAALTDMCSKTLRDENFIENYKDYLFNFEIANQSIQYINYDLIPTIKNSNPGIITDIEFNCNLAYFNDKKLSDMEIDTLHSGFSNSKSL